jgi:uncharacterized protein (TIGR02996 family)
MADEHDFLAHISANPADRVARLAYADWLEEQGDNISLLKVTYLRLDDEIHQLPDSDKQRDPLILRLRKVAELLTQQWKATVARVPIEECRFQWNFECPKQWENLQQTQDETVRVCSACEKQVYFCSSIAEAYEYAWLGLCVAIDVKIRRSPGDLPTVQGQSSTDIGLPLFDPALQREFESGERIEMGMLSFEPEEERMPESFWQRIARRFGFGG